MLNRQDALRIVVDDFGHNAEFEYINSGGCAVFASLMGEYFPKNFLGCAVFTYHPNVSDRIDPMIQMVRKNNKFNTVDAWKRNGVDFVHVIAMFKDDEGEYGIDALEGVIVDNQCEMWGLTLNNVGLIPLDVMSDLANKKEGWNTCFDRSLIFKIRMIIKKQALKLNGKQGHKS